MRTTVTNYGESTLESEDESAFGDDEADEETPLAASSKTGYADAGRWVRQQETPLAASSKTDYVEAEKDKLEWWHIALVPVCGFLVMFSVPSMTYGLYKSGLMFRLGLTTDESQDIVSATLLGDMGLSFVSGWIRDNFGYARTVLYGGGLAIGGALTWFALLKDGGAPGSPGWIPLAAGFMVMGHGARTMYFAAMGAILIGPPKKYVGSMSALMAMCVSTGYIIMPILWNSFFKPPPGNLKYPTTPVGHFFALIAVLYSGATILGLCVAHMLPGKSSQAKSPDRWAKRWINSKEPASLTLFAYVSLSLAFVYTFMTSGVATAANHAKANITDIAYTIQWMGVLGLVSRCLHGFGTDLVAKRIGRAAQFLFILFATFVSLIGFGLLAYEFHSGRGVFKNKPEAAPISKEVWRTSCQCIAFSFGGLFSLLPATTRTIYGGKEFGFWLGLFFALTGMLTFFYGRLGTYGTWGLPFYAVSLVAGVLSSIRLIFQVCKLWGKFD